MASEHPFFLPKGSIRALLAVILVAGSLVCVIMEIQNAEAIHTLTGVAVTHYFNARGKIEPGNG